MDDTTKARVIATLQTLSRTARNHEDAKEAEACIALLSPPEEAPIALSTPAEHPGALGGAVDPFALGAAVSKEASDAAVKAYGNAQMGEPAREAQPDPDKE